MTLVLTKSSKMMISSNLTKIYELNKSDGRDMRTMAQARWTRRIGTAVSATALVGAGLVGVAAPAQAALTAAACTGSGDFAAGSGNGASAGTPYRVRTDQQLYNATACATGVYLEQTANINLSGVTWSAANLSANYNGGGFTISNLTHTAGLFKEITAGAVFENVTLTGFTITAGRDSAGALTGLHSGGTIRNVTLQNSTVTNNQDGLGGLVGVMDSSSLITGVTATNVTVTGATGKKQVGGLVGRIDSSSGDIVDSSFSGTVSAQKDGSDSKVGGLVGSMFGGGSEITGSTVVNSTISGTGLYVGGLVGDAGQGTITSSSSSGTVTGSNHTGGLVGSSGVAIDKSHSSSTVTASPTNSVYIGGLVGTQSTAAITKSFATGDVTASAGNNVGGLVGNLNSGSVTDSHATGSVTGASVVGGLAGRMNAPVTSSYSTGLVTGTADGGLIGTRSSGTVTFSYFDITVNPTATPDPLKGIGSTTTTMKTFSLYDSGAWSIYDGWESTPTKTWGICDASGYPFLRWYQTTDPNCPSAPAPSPPAPSPSGGGGTTTPTVVMPVVVTPVAEVPPTSPTADPLGPQDGPTVTKLTPGGTEVTTGGAPTPVKTVPNKKKDTVTSSGDDWKVTTVGRTPAGATTTLGPKNSVQIPQGGSAVVSGKGYQPGTSVRVYAMNPAVLLGTLTVGSDGSFSGTVPWPAGLPAGASVLQMNGYSVNDVVRSYSLGINVTKVPAARMKTVTSTIYFAAGSSKLSPEALRKLAKIASSVPKGAKATTIVSAGYVQPTPDTSNDFTLSTARATTVADQLKANKLKGKYFITGRGVAKEKDARGRKVVVTITYTVR